MQRICTLDTDSLTKSGKSTVSFAFLGKIYRFFDEIRRMKDRRFGPGFLSLKAASCLSEFTQTWREKTGKTTQTSCTFPANSSDMVRKSGTLGLRPRRDSTEHWNPSACRQSHHIPRPHQGFSPKENPAHPGCTGCSYLAAKKSLG